MSTVLHPRIEPRRGAPRARTWWGRAWARAVEEASYGEAELRAARKLARGGRVGRIQVADGVFVAAVEEGDAAWTVAGSLPVFDEAGRASLVEAIAAETGRVAALLSGDLPHALVEHAEEAGVELLPYGGEFGATCTCDHWAEPCQHALAVLYQLTWLIEADPLILLHLRGLGRDDLLADLHALTTAASSSTDGTPDGDDAAVDLAIDASLRATRILDLLDRGESVDHLF